MAILTKVARRIGGRFKRMRRSIANKLEPYSAFQLVSVGLLYGIALFMFIYAVLTEPALQQHSVRLVTVIGAIILPFFAVAASFAMQILGVFIDGRRSLEEARAQSRFLAALESGRGRSVSSRLFFSHLLDEWDRNLGELREGKITVLQEYWKVSAALYHHLARRIVECTSVLPLEFWDSSRNDNAELMSYLEQQKTNLLANGVRVCRTFILRAEEIAGDRAERFFRLAYTQIKDGFELYYITLDDISDEQIRARLHTDFALIDDTILMVGRLASTNRAVYYYDFYDLRAACTTGILKSDLGVFENPVELTAGIEAPRLLLDAHRHKVSTHPRLAEPNLAMYRDLIDNAERGTR